MTMFPPGKWYCKNNTGIDMKVAFVASEVVPFAKTGGLADVAGALPIEMKKMGVDIKVFMPKYYSVDEHKYKLKYLDSVGELRIRVNGYPQPVSVYTGFLPNSNVEIFFIDAPKYFHRSSIYTNDWDEDERFILFQKAVIEVMQRLGWAPDLIHCNDWQTGLIPLMIRDNYNWDRMFDNTSIIFTIHNIGYQGVFGIDTLRKAEIKEKHFYETHAIEHGGAVNFMKAAILYSDIINTVSDTYARELLSSEYGAGMHYYLWQRKDDLYGILNGIDYDVWDPERDRHLPHHYNRENLSGKTENKKFMLEKMHLPYHPDVPVVGMVTRMVSQKGFDILEPVIFELMQYDLQFVILGSGESKYEEMFNHVARIFPHKVSVYLGYNNELAHLIEAGADIFLMPSAYEPCGLNQMYSLLYGTVPVVRKTGGLADTVFDWDETSYHGHDYGNGFSFNDYAGWALSDAVKRAVNRFHDKATWTKIQQNGMKMDLSWKGSAEKYLELYKRAMAK